jgi:hypothetical protein
MAVADRTSVGRMSAVVEVCGDHLKLQVASKSNNF